MGKSKDDKKFDDNPKDLHMDDSMHNIPNVSVNDIKVIDKSTGETMGVRWSTRQSDNGVG